MKTRSGSMMVDGASIAFRAEGDGESDVTLIHGFAAHSHWWDAVVPKLTAQCRILRIDLSGHGDSDHRERYSVATWATEIAHVQRAVFGESSPLLVGHSLGGRVVIAAADRPDVRASGVIVFDTVFPEPLPFGGMSTWRSVRRVYDSRETALQRFRLVPHQPLETSSLALLAEHSVRRVEDGWTWKHDHRLDPAALAVPPLTRQSAPLTIAFGRFSSIVDSPMALRAAGVAGQRSSVVVVPGAHHHVIVDSPSASAALILHHVASAAGGP